MIDEPKNQLGPRTRTRLLGRLDALVKSGRVTEEEAARLRTAGEPNEFERAIREIRARHVGTRLDSAVRGGNLTRQEADSFLERVQAGEHSPSLRAHLRGLVPGSRSRRRAPDPGLLPGAN